MSSFDNILAKYYANIIYVVTPSFNAVETIDRTITSVITQAGRFYIRYHVQDGGSTDGTLERLYWWKERLNTSDILLACIGIDFTFSSEPDVSMYDGLCKGFAYFNPPPPWEAFISQINADDIYMQGAFAFINAVYEQFTPQEVSWVGGSHSVMHDDFVIPTTVYDCKLPTEIIANGLCEGEHWHFVQQEGVFYRYWLWQAVNPTESLSTFKYAGDWNLWRMFAQHAIFIQTPVALGSFRKSANQISTLYRDKYMLEIENTISRENRLRNFNNIIEGPPIVRRKFSCIYSSKGLSIQEEDCNNELRTRYKALHGKVMPDHITLHTISRQLYIGNIKNESPPVYNDPINISGSIASFDIDWQYPAITEYHAYNKLKMLGGIPAGCLYIAFPWATMIDNISLKTEKTTTFINRFKNFIQCLPAEGIRITVCQHIRLKKYLSLFIAAGIKHIFWSHATNADKDTLYEGIQIHPFPLYPVQEVLEEKPLNEKKYLFSFIGAKPTESYLTPVRSWIIDNLHSIPNGLIVSKDIWHYNHIVYDTQIHSITIPIELNDKLEQSARDFRQSLVDSIFCLCPSGTGPNTIRLWEAIEAGCIPVILSDSHWLPGSAELWNKSVVFCEETLEAVLALPERLKALAMDTETLNTMRNNLRQLCLLYGKHVFITDILDLTYKLTKPKILSLNTKISPKPIRVKLVGKHSNRTPLSYDVVSRYSNGRLAFTEDTSKADILISGLDSDIFDIFINTNNISNQQQFVVLSEEPLWDCHLATSSQKTSKYLINTTNTERTITSLNHNTTNIFSFSAIPYFILTDNNYLIRYRTLLTPSMCRSPYEILEFWDNPVIHTAFYMEHRADPSFKSCTNNMLIAQSEFRTDLAKQVCRGNVIRVGKGWTSCRDERRRADWHLDKLTNLYKKTHICSALENTISRHYISEKIFDALAIGAIPIYAGSPNHRIYDLLSNHAFIDISNLSVADSANVIDTFIPNLDFCKRFIADQNKIFKLISNTSLIEVERSRIINEIISELSNLV